MPYHVRWAEKADIPIIVSIGAFSLEEEYSVRGLLRMMRDQDGRGILLAADSESDVPLGFTVFNLEQSGYDILDLVVDPHYRGMGIGSSLLERFQRNVDRGRKKWAKYLIHEENLNGQIFLKRRGFRAEVVIRQAFEDGRDGYQMIYRGDKHEKSRSGEQGRQKAAQ